MWWPALPTTGQVRYSVFQGTPLPPSLFLIFSLNIAFFFKTNTCFSKTTCRLHQLYIVFALCFWVFSPMPVLSLIVRACSNWLIIFSSIAARICLKMSLYAPFVPHKECLSLWQGLYSQALWNETRVRVFIQSTF